MDKITKSLEAAVRVVADRYRSELDAHPSLDELADLQAGRLSTADSERLRDHLALCPTCTRLFLDLAAFPRLEAAGDVEAASEHEVAAAWRKMGPEVLAAAPPSPAPALLRYRRRTRALLAAATLLLTVGAVWIGILHRRLANPSGPRFAQVIDVDTARGSRPYFVRPGAERILLVVGDVDFGTYSRGRLEISRGDKVLHAGDLEPPGDDRSQLTVELARERFPDGTYRLKIFGLDAGGRRLLKDVQLTLADAGAP